jgi:hypothetical protein
MPPPVRKLSLFAAASFLNWEGRRLHQGRLLIQTVANSGGGRSAPGYHSSPASCQRLSFSGSVVANAPR